MSLGNVNIIRQDGNVVSSPISQDGLSGLVFFTSESIATSTALNYKLFQLSDALTFTTDDTTVYFHISEYFSKSEYPLYVTVIDRTPTSTDNFDEVIDLVRFANGDLRQIGVYNGKGDYASTQVAKLQTSAELAETEYTPVQILYTAFIDDVVENFADLSSLNSPRVSVLIGQDFSGVAYDLWDSGKFVSNIGKVLGIVSLAKVQQNIGHVASFNLSDTVTIPGFIDGTLYSEKPKLLLDQLDTYQYIFYRKFTGLAGVYINYDGTASDPAVTDFATLSANRTYDKSFRLMRIAYLPFVNGNIYLNKSGNIEGGNVLFLKGIGEKTLQGMKDSGEISNFSVDIDPTQKVLVNKTLNVVAKIQPVGVSKFITIELGFSLSV